MNSPGLLVSVPASGAGKTTVMLGLLRALRDEGFSAQPVKSGLYNIDPAFRLVRLPFGDPERRAGKTAAALNFRAARHRRAETRPVRGECGGYAVLGAGLTDQEGALRQARAHLGAATSFGKRKIRPGWRRATLRERMPGFAPARPFGATNFRSPWSPETSLRSETRTARMRRTPAQGAAMSPALSSL